MEPAAELGASVNGQGREQDMAGKREPEDVGQLGLEQSHLRAVVGPSSARPAPLVTGTLSARAVVEEVTHLLECRLPEVRSDDPALPTLRGAAALLAQTIGLPLQEAPQPAESSEAVPS